MKSVVMGHQMMKRIVMGHRKSGWLEWKRVGNMDSVPGLYL